MKYLTFLTLLFWASGVFSQEMSSLPPNEDTTPALQTSPVEGNTETLKDDTIPPKVEEKKVVDPSNLVQFDETIKVAKEDPYPLESYKGPFLKEDIKSLREEFTVKNMPSIKATLEKWYQKQDNSFPIEGFLMLGAIYDQLQCYPKALSLIEGALFKVKDEKQKITLIMAKAQILRHQGNYQDSLDTLAQISAKERSLYPEIFFSEGLVFLYLGDESNAIGRFREYLGFLPSGPQSAHIRRAVAWLLLQKNGHTNASPSNQISEKDMEKMLQLLIEKQRSTDFGDLTRSSDAGVDDKSLSLSQKDLEDLDQYSNIAD